MRPLILLCLIGLLAAPVRAGVRDCRDAISSFRSARSDVATAVRTYATCIADSDGHDDCSSEFSTLQSAHDDFESAVASYQSDCP
jgi:hypothetical protein